MQSKRGSLFEACINVVVGLCIALPAQSFYFYMNNIEVPLSANVGLAAWMTAVSILRSYTLRRYFNYKTTKGNK